MNCPAVYHWRPQRPGQRAPGPVRSPAAAVTVVEAVDEHRVARHAAAAPWPACHRRGGATVAARVHRAQYAAAVEHPQPPIAPQGWMAGERPDWGGGGGWCSGGSAGVRQSRTPPIEAQTKKSAVTTSCRFLGNQEVLWQGRRQGPTGNTPLEQTPPARGLQFRPCLICWQQAFPCCRISGRCQNVASVHMCA